MSNIIIPKMFGQPLNLGHWSTDGLVFYWRGIEAVDAIDESLYGNDGVITGATWVGDALNLLPENAWVELSGGSDSLDIIKALGDEITVSAWINVSGDGAKHIVSNGLATISSYRYNQWFLAQYTSNNIRFGVGDGTTQERVSSAVDSISLNQWHHVVGRIEASGEMRIFIDGVMESDSITLSITPYSDQKTAAIGKNMAANSVEGLVKYISVYNRALADSEIAELTINPGLPMQVEPAWRGKEVAVVGGLSDIYYKTLLQGVA